MALAPFSIQIPSLDLSAYTPDPKAFNLVSESTAQRLNVLPLFSVKNILAVAMATPSDFMALDELKRETGCEIFPLSTDPSVLKASIATYYRNIDSLNKELAQFFPDIQIEATPMGRQMLPFDALEDTVPSIKLVNRLISHAVNGKASDIHIEPDDKHVRVRYRVDGALRELASIPLNLLSPIVSRIKIMAQLDISESRIPQDGRVRMIVSEKEIDLRVSTFPTIYGENIVLRVLDKETLSLSLTQLGFSVAMLPKFQKAVQNPYGIILVAGPTGSGKTTTLYSTINFINTIEKNIITMEDPVEYSLDMVRQSQINPKIGLTFASGLRNMLRQDPDVIMVGEIRDLETAEMAIQAALTGHLVFSTVHTNDAASTIARMLDIGTEPFLLTSALNTVLAQRLVRNICPQCKKPHHPDPHLLEALGAQDNIGEALFYKGDGCVFCRFTGYSGRSGIFELMNITDSIRELMIRKSSSVDIKRVAQKEGMETLFDDALQKARDGITTVEEVFRVTRLNL